MEVLVSGSLAYDRIMNFDGRFQDHILPDKIHMLNISFHVRTFRQGFGGTAGNIAYNLALLREVPIVVGAHGNDFSEYEAWCRKCGIITQYSKQVEKFPTASVYIITDRRDNQISGFFAGAMEQHNGRLPKRLVNQVGLAIVSPGNPRDMKTYPGVFRKNKIPFFYDPGQQIPTLSKQDLVRGLSGAKIFISNDYELALVFKKTGLTIPALLRRVEAVVTTRGEKGSVIVTRHKTIRIPPARPRNTSDPTGAGDAYRAGLMKGLILNLPYEKAGRLAAVTSVYTVEKYGTQTHRFTWQQLKRRYRENFKESL